MMSNTLGLAVRAASLLHSSAGPFIRLAQMASLPHISWVMSSKAVGRHILWVRMASYESHATRRFWSRRQEHGNGSTQRHVLHLTRAGALGSSKSRGLFYFTVPAWLNSVQLT